MKKVILSIEGMTCSACSSGLEKYLNKQEGINDAIVNLVMATATIECEDNVTLETLNKYVEEAGFLSIGEYNPQREINKNKQDKKYLIIFGLLSLFIMYLTMGHMIHLPSIYFLSKSNEPLNYLIVLFLISILYLGYGLDILKNGYKNLIHKTPNMDTLVSIGVISSFVFSIINSLLVILGHDEYIENLYFESVCIVIFFIKLGRFIDGRSKDKTKDAVAKLVMITPQKALLKTSNGEKEVTIDEVKKDDILIVKPGDKIAVDGIVVQGQTYVDESFITGESVPVKKELDDKVIAGSINYDGYLEYKATKIGKDSTISQIVRLVVEATNTKAPIARLADKISSIFVPFIIILACIGFIGTLIISKSLSDSLNTFVSVLVVACPCALGLATPLAIMVSLGVCANDGILVKASFVLENASKIDTIVFDKTGTLTYGNLKIAQLNNYSDYTEQEFLAIVSSLENMSTHPISLAFKEFITQHPHDLKKVEEFVNKPGEGLEGVIDNKKYVLGNRKALKRLKIDNEYLEDEEELTSQACSIIYVIEDKKVIGLIGISDIVRLEASQVVKKLKHKGLEVVMLTGDNAKTAHLIAKNLGITKLIANVTPSAKASEIKKLKQAGKKVMMVGDGINDAPSLALSDIGVSIGSGTDIAADSSNVILLQNDLEKINDLINISHKTVLNIKENLFWAYFYNCLMIPIALGVLKPWGITLNPMFGSLAMMLSSLTVVFNALRLRYIKLERKKRRK